MRGLSTCLVLVLSSAVAAAGVGREEAEGRYQLNHQEDRAMNSRYQLNTKGDRAMKRRYQLHSPKEIHSIDLKVQKKWNDINRLNSLFHTPLFFWLENYGQDKLSQRLLLVPIRPEVSQGIVHLRKPPSRRFFLTWLHQQQDHPESRAKGPRLPTLRPQQF